MTSITKNAKTFTELLQFLYNLDPLTRFWTLSEVISLPGQKHQLLACYQRVIPQARGMFPFTV